jgi:hypothetical protein
VLGPQWRAALRCAWRATWTSRLGVLATGAFAWIEIGRAPGTAGFDPARVTEPFGYLGNALVAPVARWDSVWYLAIAHDGYREHTRAAFFPLYPVLIRAFGWIVGSDLVAGALISLGCMVIGLAVVHRLAELELGPERARAAVYLIAFFPMALFLSAVYTESLFLALSAGALLAGRQGRWALAGMLGAAASATRSTGLLLVAPLLLLFLYGPRGDGRAAEVLARRGPRWPRYRPGPRIGWIALVPLGTVAFCVYLAIADGDGLAPFHVQAAWYRHFSVLGGVREGAVAAWDGLRQLLHGSPRPIYFTASGGDPLKDAATNLMLFGFLLATVAALAGALRRLSPALGAYALLALALPLSYPVAPQPLASYPRYAMTVVPLALWAADRAVARRVLVPLLCASATLLGLFTASFATWHFIA